MKISDLNECINRMRNVYLFRDEDADIQLFTDPQQTDNPLVTVNVWDKENDVFITLETARRE